MSIKTCCRGQVGCPVCDRTRGSMQPTMFIRDLAERMLDVLNERDKYKLALQAISAYQVRGKMFGFGDTERLMDLAKSALNAPSQAKE